MTRYMRQTKTEKPFFKYYKKFQANTLGAKSFSTQPGKDLSHTFVYSWFTSSFLQLFFQTFVFCDLFDME